MRNWRTRALLVAVILSHITILSLAQSWLPTKTLQNAKTRFAAVTAGGKVYFAGGFGSGTVYAGIDVYDTLTGEITPLGVSLSMARADLRGVYNESANKIYFGGGQPNSGNETTLIDVYNVATGNFGPTMALPRATGFMCAASYGTKILFAGGSNDSGYYDDLYVYDVAGGSPRTYHLSEARDQIAVATVGSKIVMAGGHKGGGVYSDNVDIFDLATETFVSHSLTLSVPRAFLGGTAVGNKVFFGGGQTGPDTGTPNVDVFDLSGSTPTSAGQLQLSEGRYYLWATSVGSKVFFGGGGEATAAYDNVDIFDVNNGIPSSPLVTQLSVPRTPMTAASVGTKALFAGGTTGPGANPYSNLVDIYDTKIRRPLITALSPSDNASDISYTTDLLITFSERIKKGTGDIIVKINGIAVQTIPISSGSVTIDNNTKLAININALKSNSEITIELPADGIKDVDGNSYVGFVAPEVWTFNTAPLVNPTTAYIDTYVKGGGNQTVSMTADASKLTTVKFMSRGISDDPLVLNEKPATLIDNTYSVTLSDSDFSDEIGLHYYFSYTDISGTTDATNVKRTYIKFPTRESSKAIPNLKNGNTMDKYQIISIPMKLDEDDILDVFSDLGAHDAKLWRLYKYENDNNVEKPQDIQTGRGYWLITRDPEQIRPGSGTTVQFSNEAQSIPFTITLAKDWNLIGNPYDFDISWEDIRDANPQHKSILSEKVGTFNGTSLDNTGIEINAYRGAFVENLGDTPIQIQIPVRKNPDINRVAADEVDLSSYNWKLKLELSDGAFTNATGGIGMNKQATLTGRDRFDRVPIPVPDEMEVFQISFPHPEINKNFVTEVVPSGESHVWDFNIDRTTDRPLTLRWDNTLINETEKQLYLIDLSFGTIKDMKAEGSYTIPPSTHNLKCVFGDEEFIARTFDDMLPYAGVPYPNPASDAVRVPFFIPSKAGNLNVNIEVINTQGASIATLADGSFESGRYEVVWNTSGKSGLYIVEMKIGSSRVRSKVVVK